MIFLINLRVIFMSEESWISTLKEDLYVFNIVFGKGIGKYFYSPAFRAVFIFRLSQLCFKLKMTKPFAYLLTNLNDFLHGIWISPRVKVGKGFLPSHPRGIVINPDSVIGNYCSILHQVTLGGENIIIGDYVEILAGSKIINDKNHNKSLNIGSGAVIAAGAIVLKDVPPNAVMAGIPAEIKKYRNKNENWVSYRLNNIENS